MLKSCSIETASLHRTLAVGWWRSSHDLSRVRLVPCMRSTISVFSNRLRRRAQRRSLEPTYNKLSHWHGIFAQISPLLAQQLSFSRICLRFPAASAQKNCGFRSNSISHGLLDVATVHVRQRSPGLQEKHRPRTATVVSTTGFRSVVAVCFTGYLFRLSSSHPEKYQY